MKTAIYYFTGTGNSLFIAKKLSKEIDNSELIAISSIIQNPAVKADKGRVGFIFPVYYCGLPKIVEDFISKIGLELAETVFYINTSGDDGGVDCSTGKINKILAKKGFQLNGGYNISMPGNYIKMYDLDPEEEQLKKIKESEYKAKNIADKILSGITEVKYDKFGFIAKVINNLWQKRVNRSDNIFFCTESCDSCGICAEVCPVDNIKIVNKKPEWQHKCQECLACINYCPKIAIQTKNSINRGRYHHPDVSANDLVSAGKTYVSNL